MLLFGVELITVLEALNNKSSISESVMNDQDFFYLTTIQRLLVWMCLKIELVD